MHFVKKVRLILQRSSGIIRDSDSLVQHFNPACRIARTFAYLPVARLLLLLCDHDLTRPIYDTLGYLYVNSRKTASAISEMSPQDQDDIQNDFAFENGLGSHLHARQRRENSFNKFHRGEVIKKRLSVKGVAYFACFQCWKMVSVATSAFLLSLYAYTPFTVSEFFTDLLGLILVNIWVFGIYFLAVYNFIAGVTVACVVVAVPLLSTAVYLYRKGFTPDKKYSRDINVDHEVKPLDDIPLPSHLVNKGLGGPTGSPNNSYYLGDDDADDQALKHNTNKNASYRLGSQLDSHSIASQSQFPHIVAMRNNNNKMRKNRILGPPISGFLDEDGMHSDMRSRYEEAFTLHNQRAQSPDPVNPYYADDNVSVDRGNQNGESKYSEQQLKIMRSTANNNNTIFTEQQYANAEQYRLALSNYKNQQASSSYGPAAFNKFNRPVSAHINSAHHQSVPTQEYNDLPSGFENNEAPRYQRGSMLEGDQNDLSYITASDNQYHSAEHTGNEFGDNDSHDDYSSVVSAPEKSMRHSRSGKKQLRKKSTSPSMLGRLKKQFTFGQSGSQLNQASDVIITPKRQVNNLGGSSVVMGNFNVATVPKKRTEVELPPLTRTPHQSVVLTRPNSMYVPRSQSPSQRIAQQRPPPIVTSPPPVYYSNRQRRRMHKRTDSGNYKGAANFPVDETRDFRGPGGRPLSGKAAALRALNGDGNSADPQQVAPSDFTMVTSDQVVPVVNILANLEHQMRVSRDKTMGNRSDVKSPPSGSEQQEAVSDAPMETPMSQSALHPQGGRGVGRNRNRVTSGGSPQFNLLGKNPQSPTLRK